MVTTQSKLCTRARSSAVVLAACRILCGSTIIHQEERVLPKVRKDFSEERQFTGAMALRNTLFSSANRLVSSGRLTLARAFHSDRTCMFTIPVKASLSLYAQLFKKM